MPLKDRCILKKCCCIIPLETGTCLTCMVDAFFRATDAVIFFINFTKPAIQLLFTISICLFVMCLIFLYGLKKKRLRWIFFYACFQVVQIIFDLAIVLVLNLTPKKQTQEFRIESGFMMHTLSVFPVVRMCLSTYFMIVVYSYFRKLEADILDGTGV